MSILQAILDLIQKILGGGSKPATGTGGTNGGDWSNIQNPLPYVDPNKPMPQIIPIADLPILNVPQGYEQPAQAWTQEQVSTLQPLPFETV